MTKNKKQAAKRRRQASRDEAKVQLEAMSDSDLNNMCHELAREINARNQATNEVRIRLDWVRMEKERRRTVTSTGIHISDHAVLRYLERHKGVDTKAAREEISAMAGRVRQLDSGNMYARRKDDETGLTMGINEETNVVTTVFNEAENKIIAA